MSIKKMLCLFLCLCIVFVFSACGGSGGSESETANIEDIDLDLTSMSVTMTYSQVCNMAVSPQSYLGQTVKIAGTFDEYYNEKTERNYYSCMVKDATQCCAQGLEFQLAGDYSYPEDYPEEGEQICVIGVFDVYQEADNPFCCVLKNAVLVD